MDYQRRLAWDTDHLLQRLLTVDDTSLTELQEFKRALQNHVTAPDNSSISPATIVPTLAAGKLTRGQVFTYFRLRNESSEKWGIVEYDIPRFELHPDFEESSPGPSDWLLNSLDRCSCIFSRENESYIRIFINLIIMEVVNNVQQSQPSGICNSLRELPSARLSTPPLPHARPIHAFTEAYISSTVHVEEKVLRITGRIDIGFCHQLISPTRADADAPDTSLLVDTYLTIIERNGITCDFEVGFNQLLVCLAIAHRARVRKLRRAHAEAGNSTVFGVLSDGKRFVFICLDNDSMEFSVVKNLAQILRYFRHCLSGVATSSPTSSPNKIHLKRRSHAPTDEKEMQEAADNNNSDEDDEEEFDFIELQKRVFLFRTAEYDEDDILAWN